MMTLNEYQGLVAERMGVKSPDVEFSEEMEGVAIKLSDLLRELAAEAQRDGYDLETLAAMSLQKKAE